MPPSRRATTCKVMPGDRPGPLQERAAVALVRPAVAKPREACRDAVQQTAAPIAVTDIGGAHVGLETMPRVSTSRWRLRPLTFLAPS